MARFPEFGRESGRNRICASGSLSGLRTILEAASEFFSGRTAPHPCACAVQTGSPHEKRRLVTRSFLSQRPIRRGCGVRRQPASPVLCHAGPVHATPGWNSARSRSLASLLARLSGTCVILRQRLTWALQVRISGCVNSPGMNIGGEGAGGIAHLDIKSDRRGAALSSSDLLPCASSGASVQAPHLQPLKSHRALRSGAPRHGKGHRSGSLTRWPSHDPQAPHELVRSSLGKTSPEGAYRVKLKLTLYG